MEILNYILIAVPYAETTNELKGVNCTSWYVLAGFIVFLILFYLLIINKTKNF